MAALPLDLQTAVDARTPEDPTANPEAKRAITGDLLLSVLLDISTNEAIPTKLRIAAAAAGLPFALPKLVRSEVSGPGGRPLESERQVQFTQILMQDPKSRRLIEDLTIHLASSERESLGIAPSPYPPPASNLHEATYEKS